jgi:hypothetical protein
VRGPARGRAAIDGPCTGPKRTFEALDARDPSSNMTDMLARDTSEGPFAIDAATRQLELNRGTLDRLITE